MSTVHRTAPPAAAKTPRARTTAESPTTTEPSGATPAPHQRRRRPLAGTVRNVGIALDTAARVVFLGRDGVKY
jgi:hypothetical protein